MTEELFSVCQYFPDETHEYTRRFVPLEEAMTAAFHYCTSVGAKLGATTRVIVTDGGDSIVFEWLWDSGVTFPPSAALGHLKYGQPS